ncbi:alpha/beta-hydrolase family protein [Corynebacterium sp. TAE3-ERU30]|uniref:alpha/beta-hydrolase family protein n=1 Tax=Corynebacterium sp. TAE3-ERU30 TaxID=2849496 RepID=UPI001C47B8A3|nr:alpha/beta-hydrolase family protein [Corynebacterium sp. TAE3-ERU30]MBV7281874.1 alpha/beta hydrolase [Corynebacterium sp. TAE3-ERU30]
MSSSDRPERLTVTSRHYNVVGLIGVALFFAAAYTPSLLPRTWYYQGIVSGVTANIGYCVGVGLSQLGWMLLRRLGPRTARLQLSDRQRRLIDYIGILVLALVALGVVWASLSWQEQLAAAQGLPTPHLTHFLPLSAALGLALCFGLIWLWRLLAAWAESTAEVLEHRGLPPGIAAVVSNIFVVVIMVASVGIIIPNTGLTIIERQAADRNATYREDIAPPTVAYRSAGPGSEISWEGLGYEGSRFIADGATKQQLEAVTQRPAREPIRLYAGVGNGADMQERVDKLVAELDRTGAADRQALLILPVTGTGWANPVAAQAFELLFAGDTAIASAQFGVLPSAVSFLSDSGAAAEAGRELIHTVAQWWSDLPAAHQPELYLYGESLGTTGVEAALESLRALNVEPDGVFMVGPPRSNELHRWLTSNREPGSPEYQPRMPESSAVRFAATGRHARQLGADPRWGEHRLLYLQHATDPVVWWEPNLLWKRPDWLVEPLGPGRAPQMTWYPVITFWQVSADLGGAADVPDGFGHNYATELLDGWIAVTRSARVSDADAETLRAELDVLLQRQGPEKGHISELGDS